MSKKGKGCRWSLAVPRQFFPCADVESSARILLVVGHVSFCLLQFSNESLATPGLFLGQHVGDDDLGEEVHPQILDRIAPAWRKLTVFRGLPLHCVTLLVG